MVSLAQGPESFINKIQADNVSKYAGFYREKIKDTWYLFAKKLP